MAWYDDVGRQLQAAYANTLGPAGQAFNDRVVAPIGDDARAILHAPADLIGGAGQAYNDVVGGVKGFYAGTGQVLNRSGNAIANAGEQVPVIVRDISKPVGQGLYEVGRGLGDLGSGVGSGVKNTGTGLGLGAIALIGLAAFLLVNESKSGTVTRAATEGAVRGAKA